MQSTTEHAHWRGGNATDRLFIVAVILKGLDGALGMIGGAILAFVKPATLNWLAAVLRTHELSRNPHNFIATLLVHSVAQLDVGKLAFAAAYPFIHGALKAFLAIMLLIGRPWSYPAGVAFLGVFVAYSLPAAPPLVVDPVRLHDVRPIHHRPRLPRMAHPALAMVKVSPPRA